MTLHCSFHTQTVFDDLPLYLELIFLNKPYSGFSIYSHWLHLSKLKIYLLPKALPETNYSPVLYLFLATICIETAFCLLWSLQGGILWKMPFRGPAALR